MNKISSNQRRSVLEWLAAVYGSSRDRDKKEHFVKPWLKTVSAVKATAPPRTQYNRWTSVRASGQASARINEEGRKHAPVYSLRTLMSALGRIPSFHAGNEHTAFDDFVSHTPDLCCTVSSRLVARMHQDLAPSQLMEMITRAEASALFARR